MNTTKISKTTPVRAGFLKKSLIMGGILFHTLHVCVAALILNLFGKLSREKADAYIASWAKHLLKLTDVKLTVHNPHHVDLQSGQRYIVMSNHASHYDIPITFCALPGSIRMVGKKELRQIPVFGRALEQADFIFIDRKNHAQAIKDLDRVKEKLDHGLIVWIAPSGTRSAAGELGRFKKGGFILAIETQAMIVPIVIKGSHNVLPAFKLDFHLHQEVHVHIGKPIDASLYSLKQKDDLLEIVHNQMQSLM